MMKRLACLIVLVCTLNSGAQAACDDPKPLRLAVIPKKSQEMLAREYRPLLQALEKSLGRRVELVHSNSYTTSIEGLVERSIDVAELGPAAYAIAKKRDPAITPFATLSQSPGHFSDAPNSYRALLVTRAGQGLDKLENLRGKTLNLIDPASTSGALIPRQAIAALTGSSLEGYFQRISYAGSHDRAIQAVQRGIVDAAFVSSRRMDEAMRTGTLKPDELKVVWRSEPIAYDPFVYRSNLCSPLVERIRRTFFSETPALQAMFKDMKANGFTPVADENYQAIHALYDSMQ